MEPQHLQYSSGQTVIPPASPNQPPQPTQQPLKPRSVGRWVILLVAPWALFILLPILQFLLQFSLNKSGAGSGGLATVLNAASIILGLAAGLLVVISPAWIVLLVRDMSYNSRINRVPRPPAHP